MQYSYHTLRFPDDYDGEVIATLIKAETPLSYGKAVLYVHGYTDYFFQDHLAAAFTSQGYRFYAIDLRKYGRSLLEGQHPNYCSSLREYDPEITESIARMRQDGNTHIVLMGHSTGGLIASLYAEKGTLRNYIDALVLNSPFFEFNIGRFRRKVEIPIAALIGRLVPFASKQPELSPFYAKSIHRDYYGQWIFNRQWKPINGFPLYFAWLGAVRKGQQRIKKGLNIGVPVLVLCSDRSFVPSVWDARCMESDTVLNVKDIMRYSKQVGPQTTVRPIEKGMHDLFLSPQPVRETAFGILFDWLKTVVGEVQPPI